MLRSDFNFELPKELIALYPSEKRTACKMLFLDGNTGSYEDHTFIDLKNFLRPGDLLVFNDTKVIPARLYGHKETGGQVELLIERLLSLTSALSHIRASKAPKASSKIILDNGQELLVKGRENDLFLIESTDGTSILDIFKLSHSNIYLNISITSFCFLEYAIKIMLSLSIDFISKFLIHFSYSLSSAK